MITDAISIAVILTLIVILTQFIFFFRSKNECNKLAELFPDFNDEKERPLLRIQDTIIDAETKKTVEDGEAINTQGKILRTIKLIALKATKLKISPIFRNILNTTNGYLRNNIDTTAEFNILRDISERVSDSEENKIAATISLPLYIGLMGTFIGVIFGIMSIILSGQGANTNIITEESIQTFLSGVFIAMIGSLFGLFLTTLNDAYFFKKAKSARDINKNLYFNFLQAELLPTLENTLGKNLREFKENLSAFNKEFSGNIADFKGTIPAITDNLKIQTDFIKSFKEIDVPRLATVNLKIFDKLNESAELFKSFNKYTNSISKSVMKSDEMLIKVTSLLDRLANFENNINQIGALVKKSDENSVLIADYIVEKLGALKNRYQLIQEFVDKSEDSVKAVANEYVDRIKATSQKLEQEFEKSFDFANENNPFSKLYYLESVNQNLEFLAILFEKANNGDQKNDNQKLITTISRLDESIHSLKNSIRPSILKPVQFFRYIFNRNGY